MERIKNYMYVIIGLALIIITALNFYSTNDLIYDKTYVKGIQQEYEGLYLKALGENSYNNFIYYFELGYFNDSQQYCESARDLFSESNDLFSKSLAYYEKSNIKDSKLINTKIKYLDVLLDTNYNKYEACEYLEVAARQYDLGDYDAADKQVVIANEKITAHDELIPKLNKLKSELEVITE